MAGFISGHVGKTLSQERVLLLNATAQLLVEEESGEFGRATLLQKLNENLSGFRVKLVSRAVEVVIADKVMAVVIPAKFFSDGFKFRLLRAKIHGRHGLKIRGVKPRSEDRVLDRILRDDCVGFSDGGWRDHRLRFT